jgi:hypothetical protein
MRPPELNDLSPLERIHASYQAQTTLLELYDKPDNLNPVLREGLERAIATVSAVGERALATSLDDPEIVHALQRLGQQAIADTDRHFAGHHSGSTLSPWNILSDSAPALEPGCRPLDRSALAVALEGAFGITTYGGLIDLLKRSSSQEVTARQSRPVLGLLFAPRAVMILSEDEPVHIPLARGNVTPGKYGICDLRQLRAGMTQALVSRLLSVESEAFADATATITDVQKIFQSVTKLPHSSGVAAVTHWWNHSFRWRGRPLIIAQGRRSRSTFRLSGDVQLVLEGEC